MEKKRDRHKTTQLCGMILCDKSATTARDLDGYIYCQTCKVRGRWPSPEPVRPKCFTNGRLAYIDTPEPVAPPTASRVETPVLPHCRWQEQKTPGAEAFYVCENRMVHAESMFCEKHIFEAMKERDREKPKASQETPFQQSHCGRDGMLGVWSLRSENRK